MSLITPALALLLCITLSLVVAGSIVNKILRGVPPRPTVPGLARVFREWVAHVWMLPLLATGVFEGAPRRSAPASGPGAECPPVLLVHGYDMNRGCWRLLEAWLRRRGWAWVWSTNHRPRWAPIPELAAELGQDIERLKRETGASQVDVVAHSMGGVVTAWYARQLDGASNIRRLVTIGTPWGGTLLAVLGLRPEAKGLRPSSPVIDAIRPPAMPVASLWSREDQIIAPSDSSVIPEAQCIELDQGGHAEMLLDPRVWRRVGAVLAATAPPRPGAPCPKWPPEAP
jgi:pimeloyl-ACP methyl ester carboxylesterase